MNTRDWFLFQGIPMPKGQESEIYTYTMPQGQVRDIFTNITKVNYLMQIADFLKVNIKIEAI